MGPSDYMQAALYALECIPTLVGRLEHLSALFDASIGHYREPKLAGSVSPEKMDSFLREIHRQMFTEWLFRPLSQRRQDLSAFLKEAGWEVPSGLDADCFRGLVPPGAREVERRLFFLGVEVLLAALRNSRGEGYHLSQWKVGRILEIAESSGGNLGLSLEDLSSGLKTSRSYLGRLFKQRTGIDYRRYYLWRRMLAAAEGLMDPERSVKEMAADLGYSDSSNFVREFRRTLGVTPADFRASTYRGAASTAAVQ